MKKKLEQQKTYESKSQNNLSRHVCSHYLFFREVKNLKADDLNWKSVTNDPWKNLFFSK